MDLLFPGSMDVSRVQFQSSNTVDSIHNYTLLQTAFRTVGVVRVSVVKLMHFKYQPVRKIFLTCTFCGEAPVRTDRLGYKTRLDSHFDLPLFFSLKFIPIESLIKRNSAVSLSFLRWFKQFFDENDKGGKYRALEARGGQNVPADSGG